MGNLPLPARYGIFGLFGGLLAFGLSLALGLDPNAPWWAFMIGGGAGGYVGGLIRQKRSGS